MNAWQRNACDATASYNTLLHLVAGIGFPEGVAYLVSLPGATQVYLDYPNVHGERAIDYAVRNAHGEWSGPSGDAMRSKYAECVRLLQQAGSELIPGAEKPGAKFGWSPNSIFYAILAWGEWPLAKLFLAHYTVTARYSEGFGYTFVNAIQCAQRRKLWFKDMDKAYQWCASVGVAINTTWCGHTALEDLLKVWNSPGCACVNGDLVRKSIVVLLLHGAELPEQRIIGNYDCRLPAWALECIENREACRRAAFAMLCLQRRGGRIARNNKDAMRLVAMAVWETRLVGECQGWEACLKSTRSKRASRGLLTGPVK